MNTVPALRLQSIAVENFKSLQKSGSIRLKPLTAIIGSNGSGKSSLLEAVETYRKIVLGGLDAALEDWSSFEHIRHKSVQHAMTGAAADPSRQYKPMRFTLVFKREKLPLRLEMAVNSRDQGNLVYIQDERVTLGKDIRDRQAGAFPEGRSMLALDQSIGHVAEALRNISFLRLNPVQIGALPPTRRSGGRIRLAADGANVAEYLIDLLKMWNRRPIRRSDWKTSSSGTGNPMCQRRTLRRSSLRSGRNSACWARCRVSSDSARR
ncbi:AAA family ATPase [Verminephrobacter eiseniae]|uniref:AAA family ATPase n=1 Tax=Verminephrobacter eiseniae TaxID=364317 RepID=UPI002237AE88|nr:AAA family ATPase [Verminephrobacter eiseniae]MCW5235255.1 hypothetical protein [Verminephrobacter eiseniae]